MELLGFDIPLWSILSVLFLTFVYLDYQRTFKLFNRYGIPGPKPWPLIGNLEMIYLSHYAVRWKLRKYGRLAGIYDGRQAVVYVFDPKLYRHMMIKESNNFINRPLSRFPLLDPPLDNSLFLLDHEKWKRVRTVTSPAFSSGKLRQMVKHINNCADILVETLTKSAGGAVTMMTVTMPFALDVIARVGFGVHVDPQNNPEDVFVVNTEGLFNLNPIKVGLAYQFPRVVYFLHQWFGMKLFMKNPLNYFSRLTDKLAKERKGKPESAHGDLFQQLLNGKTNKTSGHQGSSPEDETNPSRGLGHDMLLAQLMIFILGGTDTTAKTLTFLFHSLATNPDVQDRLLNEIDDVIGDAKDIDSELCAKVPYLRQCVHETLRMYPPFCDIWRKSSEDITIQGVHFPAGVQINIPIDVMHMDPELWDEPQRFNPNRFSSEEQGSHDPLPWIPFGTGPRNCVGQRLALLEIEIAAVKVLQKFRFESCEKTESPIRLLGIHVSEPANPVVLQVEQRV